MVEPRRSLLDRLLGRGRKDEVPRRACEQLQEILTSDQRIRAIQWFTEQEWNDPAFDKGHDRPS